MSLSPDETILLEHLQEKAKYGEWTATAYSTVKLIERLLVENANLKAFIDRLQDEAWSPEEALRKSGKE